MVGLPRATSYDVDWRVIVLPEDLHIIGNGFAALEDTERINMQFRLRRTSSSNEGVMRDVWIKASASRLLHEDGSVKAFMCTLVDVSTFKWAEAEQKLRADEALRAKCEQENVRFTDFATLMVTNIVCH